MDVYAIVTGKIVNMLEQGVVPWRRPWTSTGLPRNLVSKKPYKGVNYFLLSATKYVSPFWLTYRQARELGGHVRKREESTIVIFWKVEDSKRSNEDLEVEETDDKNQRRFLLRYYHLFNLEQCELPQAVLDKLPKIETHQHDPIEAAERIITGIPNPPEIEYVGSKAFYSPITDRITLPPRELFSSAEEFYATLNHEESHAVGHPKRLNRISITEAAPFGSPTYSFEEIVAEMSAAYLCAEAGISPAVIDNEAAYIQGWLKKIRSEKRLVVIAAAQAQRAADYILKRASTKSPRPAAAELIARPPFPIFRPPISGSEFSDLQVLQRFCNCGSLGDNQLGAPRRSADAGNYEDFDQIHTTWAIRH